jgi:hypothetical protein
MPFQCCPLQCWFNITLCSHISFSEEKYVTPLHKVRKVYSCSYQASFISLERCAPRWLVDRACCLCAWWRNSYPQQLTDDMQVTVNESYKKKRQGKLSCLKLNNINMLTRLKSGKHQDNGACVAASGTTTIIQNSMSKTSTKSLLH